MLPTGCFFTGHDVDVLPWLRAEHDQRRRALLIFLRNSMLRAVLSGCQSFYVDVRHILDAEAAAYATLLAKDIQHLRVISLPADLQHAGEANFCRFTFTHCNTLIAAYHDEDSRPGRITRAAHECGISVSLFDTLSMATAHPGHSLY